MMRAVLLSFFLVACSTGQNKSNERDLPLQKAAHYKEVVCFVYHRFGDNRFPSTNISIDDFKAHLQWLADNDYQMLNLSDALDYLYNEMPSKKTAVITIDDGYKSFLQNGLPLLNQFNFSATLFINTETVGGGDYLNWQELNEVVSRNIEIGNHTHSHDYFLNKNIDTRYIDFEKDVVEAQALIKKHLNVQPKVFAYPYGEFDKSMSDIIQSLGFKGAAAQNSGVMNNLTSNYQIPRFPMSESYAKMFEDKAKMESLRVLKKSPDSNLAPIEKDQPVLNLTLDTRGLKVKQLQCFAQGGDCTLAVVETSANEMVVELQSTHAISQRRRTLYTLTAPDSAGNWHWFSHLWVNPSVK